MKNGPKISIITACYNAEQSIEQTIQSVINQTYKNIEYIIVDGASTDSTMDIVQNYRSKLDIVISEPDKGIYDAFNKGVMAATGDIVHILNAGDFYVDNTIVHDVMNTFIEDVDVEYVHGVLKTVDAVTESINYYQFPTVSDIKSVLIRGIMPPHPAFFLKKQCFIKYGLFNSEYKIAADTRIMLSCILHSNGKFINKVITEFKQDGISSDPSYNKLRYTEVVSIVNELIDADMKVEQLFSEEQNTIKYLKIWNKFVLYNNHGITSCLNKEKYTRVVIFGTRDIAEMLYGDCLKEQIEVVGFIDNSPSRFKQHFLGKEIYNSKWLNINRDLYDACLFSIEGSHDQKIIEQLMLDVPDLKIISWKKIISSVLRGIKIN